MYIVKIPLFYDDSFSVALIKRCGLIAFCLKMFKPLFKVAVKICLHRISARHVCFQVRGKHARRASTSVALPEYPEATRSRMCAPRDASSSAPEVAGRAEDSRFKTENYEIVMSNSAFDFANKWKLLESVFWVFVS